MYLRKKKTYPKSEIVTKGPLIVNILMTELNITIVVPWPTDTAIDFTCHSVVRFFMHINIKLSDLFKYYLKYL